ncbi:MAG TPA: flagellar hook-length control protein FliK [Steroidobacteraceae bacterium]|nr:flagellar hook-length control protein FliK [Steroidobacteraceae bacterium]
MAATASDFSAALAQSLAATSPDGGAPTDTSAGKATANSDTDGSSDPPAKHSATDPVSNALTLLEQALAGALAGVASAATAAATATSASGAPTGASAASSGAVAADGKSSAAALSALLAQNLAADPKAGASGPNASGSSPTPPASTPAAPAAAANSAAAALTAAAQLSSGSHIGAQQAAADSSRMTLSSPVGTSAWTDELGTKLTWMAHQGIESASLQLSPEHLGPLQVTISVHDGQASVWFGAAQPDTRTALQQSLPQLRQLFAGHGLTLADAGVSRESPRDQGRQSSTRSAAAVSGVAAVSLDSTGARTSATGGLGLLDTYA